MDNNKEINTKTIATSLFIKDKSLSFIIKKTEKVSTAVYMITNFFDKEEPLKWDLRRLSTKLLKDIMSFNNASLSNKEITNLKAESDFVELDAMFRLAYNSGFISEMNFEIVSREIENLANLIQEYSQGQISGNKTLFDDNYFKVESPERISEKPRQRPIKDIRTIKDTSRGIKDITIGLKDSHKSIRDSVVFKGQKSDLDRFFKDNYSTGKNIESTTANAINSNKDRQNKIIEIIKNKGQVSVKDVSDEFPKIGDKTIQRELQKMVDQGQIQKEGERRWTKYFL